MLALRISCPSRDYSEKVYREQKDRFLYSQDEANNITSVVDSMTSKVGEARTERSRLTTMEP